MVKTMTDMLYSKVQEETVKIWHQKVEDRFIDVVLFMIN